MIYKYIKTITNEDYYVGMVTKVTDLWNDINAHGIQYMDVVPATDGTNVVKLVSGYATYLFSLDSDYDFHCFYSFLCASGLYSDDESAFIEVQMCSYHKSWVKMSIATFMKLYRIKQLLRSNNANCHPYTIYSNYSGNHKLPKKYDKFVFKADLLSILDDNSDVADIYAINA